MRNSDGETGKRLIRLGMGAVLVSVTAWGLYLTIFLLQLGVPTATEYWLHDAQVVKTHLLNAAAGENKVLFLGGSSVWFGIDAGLVEETLGITSINLGLYVMVPLDQILNVGLALRPGDTIILPLEYEYYIVDTPYNDWYVNHIMAVNPGFYWGLDWHEKFRFFIAVPPVRVLEGILTRLLHERLNIMRRRQAVHDPEQVLTTMRRVWRQHSIPRSIPEEIYSIRNIDQHGDAIVAGSSFISHPYAINRTVVARNYPWKTLDAFAKYCAARQVHLFIAWPPVVKDEIDFDSGLVRRNVRAIVQNLSQIGIPTLGHPAEFQYDHNLFSDTEYHLTRDGRTLHTRRLLRLIRERLSS